MTDGEVDAIVQAVDEVERYPGSRNWRYAVWNWLRGYDPELVEYDRQLHERAAAEHRAIMAGMGQLPPIDRAPHHWWGNPHRPCFDQCEI